MRRHGFIWATALLCALPLISQAQITRASTTVDRAFGQQIQLPAGVCDDRDLIGPYQTKLQTPRVFTANKSVEFEILFTPKESDSSLQVRLEKPAGFRIESGQEVSTSRVYAGTVYRSRWVVRPSSIGRHIFTIHLDGSESPKSTMKVFVDVHREGTTVSQGAPFQSFKDQTAARKSPRPLLLTPPQAAQMLTRNDYGNKARFLATATISGQIFTWDGVGGWSTVGGCLVNVGQWNGATWVNLWSGYTDNNGNYSASYEWNNAAGSGPTKTITVFAHPYGSVGSVVNTSNVLYQYGVNFNVGMSATGATMYMNDGVNNELPEGAYRIYDTANKARNYSGAFGDTMATTKIVWPSNGSYFIPNPSSPDIHIGASWSEWSSVDVVGHEYGHYHHFRICGNWLPPSPGGSHTFNQLQDPILSFVEGYATFFMNMAFNKTDYLGWINLEDNSQTNLYGQRNEAAVAGAMLDIADNGAEAGDALNILHFAWVKDVVKNRPNTMKDYHDLWVAWSWPYLTDLRTTMQTHGMNPPTFSPY